MVDQLNPINFHYPIFDRKIDLTSEELTQLELIGRVVELTNEIIDILKGWQDNVNLRELSGDITNKRKLSPTGNFTGLLMGRLVSSVLASIDDSAQKIVYLANQFADGQTGLVIDGGFFEATGIDKNYDGGRF